MEPRYIEFHPTLPIAYVVNELSSEVAVFRFNEEKARELIATMENKGGGLTPAISWNVFFTEKMKGAKGCVD